MGKHLDPLQKEFLIRRYLSNPETKLSDFCDAPDHIRGNFLRAEPMDEDGLSRILARLNLI